MFDVVYTAFSPQGLIARVSALIFAFIVAACLAFCWNQWTMVRLYSRFPSKRFEIHWLWMIVTGKYPKGVSSRHFFFQEMLKHMNPFREKGVCVAWCIHPCVIVFKENLMKYLVNEAALSDKGFAFNVNKFFVGDGLVASNYELWKVHRKLLNPSFNVSFLKTNMPSLNKYARELVEKIDTIVDKPIENIWDIMKYTTFQSMCDYVLGWNPENEKFPFFSKVIPEMIDSATDFFVDRLFQPWLYSDFMLPFFKFGRKCLKLIYDCHHITREGINELKKEHLKENSQVVESSGRILTRLHQQGILSEKDLMDQLKTFVLGGYDTVAVSMMWCLYNLGRHPQEQEKAYNEVVSIAPEGDFVYADLAEMKYLECVIKESMRLHPTIPLLSRKASSDIECGEYIIPKGAEVVFSIILLHRDPDVFPEPDKFDPERFRDSSKLRPWMYIPFAEGYRNCMGKKFAMMEMKVQLAYILRRFKITSLNKIDDSELELSMVLKPTKPPRLLFENRHSTS